MAFGQDWRVVMAEGLESSEEDVAPDSSDDVLVLGSAAELDPESADDVVVVALASADWVAEDVVAPIEPS
jgi:hypothetical protein